MIAHTFSGTIKTAAKHFKEPGNFLPTNNELHSVLNCLE